MIKYVKEVGKEQQKENYTSVKTFERLENQKPF
jgi:hypothetical protein